MSCDVSAPRWLESEEIRRVGETRPVDRCYGAWYGGLYEEVGDERGCMRRDVRCASSGEVVITAGGASVVADFPDGGHVEAAWLFSPGI